MGSTVQQTATFPQDTDMKKQGPSIVSLIDKAIVSISVTVALATLVSMFVSLIAEVIVRYLTNKGLGWPTELPSLLFPWLVMSGVVLAAQRGQHIAVTAILGILGNTATRWLLVLLQVLVGATFFYLAYIGQGLLEIVGSEEYPVTGISAYWAYLAMVVGFAAVGITALTTLWQLLLAGDPHSVRKHHSEEDV